MKNYLLLLVLCLSLTGAFAQNSSIGPYAGINSSWLSDYSSTGDVRNKIGLNAGIFYTYSKYVHFGLGAGLGFSGEGVIVKNRGVDTKTNLNYVRVPLRLLYFLNHLENPFRPKIYVGPSLGFLTKATVKSDGISTDAKDFLNNIDLGLQVGTGFNYKFAERSWFTVDLNYTHGLTKLVKLGDNHFNRNVGVTMGLAWGF